MTPAVTTMTKNTLRFCARWSFLAALVPMLIGACLLAFAAPVQSQLGAEPAPLSATNDALPRDFAAAFVPRTAQQLLLRGTVQERRGATLVFLAASFTNAAGRTSAIAPPRPKNVELARPDILIVANGQKVVLAQAQFVPNTGIAVLGENGQDGQFQALAIQLQQPQTQTEQPPTAGTANNQGSQSASSTPKQRPVYRNGLPDDLFNREITWTPDLLAKIAQCKDPKELYRDRDPIREYRVKQMTFAVDTKKFTDEDWQQFQQPKKDPNSKRGFFREVRSVNAIVPPTIEGLQVPIKYELTCDGKPVTGKARFDIGNGNIWIEMPDLGLHERKGRVIEAKVTYVFSNLRSDIDPAKVTSRFPFNPSPVQIMPWVGDGSAKIVLPDKFRELLNGNFLKKAGQFCPDTSGKTFKNDLEEQMFLLAPYCGRDVKFGSMDNTDESFRAKTFNCTTFTSAISLSTKQKGYGTKWGNVLLNGIEHKVPLVPSSAAGGYWMVDFTRRAPNHLDDLMGVIADTNRANLYVVQKETELRFEDPKNAKGYDYYVVWCPIFVVCEEDSGIRGVDIRHVPRVSEVKDLGDLKQENQPFFKPIE